MSAILKYIQKIQIRFSGKYTVLKEYVFGTQITLFCHFPSKPNTLVLWAFVCKTLPPGDPSLFTAAEEKQMFSHIPRDITIRIVCEGCCKPLTDLFGWPGGFG